MKNRERIILIYSAATTAVNKVTAVIMLTVFITGFLTAIALTSTINTTTDSNPLTATTGGGDNNITAVENSVTSNKQAASSINVTLISPEPGSIVRNNVLVNISLDPVENISLIKYRWPSASPDIVNDNVSASEYSSGFLGIALPLADALHTLLFWVYDLDNSYTYFSWQFNVDNTSIYISVVSPVEWEYYQSGTEVVFDYEPDPAALLYWWDDESQQSSYLLPLPAGDGLHSITVKAYRDDLQIWTHETFTFYTDDTPAIVYQIYNNTFVESGTVINHVAESDAVEVAFAWDGGDNQTAPGNVPDGVGDHVLEVWTRDRANNTGYYRYIYHATLGIVIDYPVIFSEIEEPEDPVEDPVEDPSNLTLLLTRRNSLSDDNETILPPETDGYGYIRPDTLVGISFTDTPDTVYYNWWQNDTHAGTNETVLAASPSGDGVSRLLEIFANGSDGNWDRVIVNLTTDGTPPAITSEGIINNSKLIGGAEISFTVNETLLYRWYSWDSGDNATDYTLPLNQGTHVLDLWLADRAENWLHKVYVYYTEYKVELADKTNHAEVLPGETINITITPSPVSVYFAWDGEVVLVPATANTTAPVTSSWHSLNVTCVDGDGIAYTTFYSFLTAIVITLDSPGDRARLKSGIVPVISFSDAPSIALYSWDGGTGIPGTPLPIPSGDGEHWLSVSAENTDLGGTEWFHATFSFTVDDTAPAIVTDSIGNGTRVNTGDEVLFTLTENCSAFEHIWDGGITEATTTGNKNATVTITPAIDGLHNLTLVMADDLGNYRAVNYSYFVDNSPVIITLVSPSNGSAVESGTLLNITFNEEPAGVYYNWNNATSNITGFSGTDIPWGNGTHVLHLYVTDGLNWNSALYAFEASDPLVRILLWYPDEGLRTTTANLEESFNVTFSETPVEVMYSWNNSENSGTFTAPEDDSYYLLNITAIETSGETATVIRGITIDNSPASVIASSPDITGNDVVRINRDDYLAIELEFDEEVISVFYQYNESFRTQALGTGVNGTLYATISLPDSMGIYSLNLRVTNTLNITADYTYYIEITGTGGTQNLFDYFSLFGILALAATAGVFVYKGPKTVIGAITSAGQSIWSKIPGKEE